MVSRNSPNLQEIRTLEGQVADLEALVRALVGRNDGRIADQGVVDTGVGHQVGLELVQVDVQRAIETERRRDRGDNLSDQAVQVREAGLGDVELVLADIEDRLVVDLVACQDRSNVQMRRCIP